MAEEFFDGEIAVVAVYLDEPQDGKPTGEAVDLLIRDNEICRSRQ